MGRGKNCLASHSGQRSHAKKTPKMENGKTNLSRVYIKIPCPVGPTCNLFSLFHHFPIFTSTLEEEER